MCGIMNSGKRCFNCTLGYTPGFAALVLVGGVLLIQGHRAAGYLFAAAMLFLAAMTFRTIDLEVCTWTVRAGRGVGTHFLWHPLHGLSLYVLLLGAIRHGEPGRAELLHSVRRRLITAAARTWWNW